MTTATTTYSTEFITALEVIAPGGYTASEDLVNQYYEAFLGAGSPTTVGSPNWTTFLSSISTFAPLIVAESASGEEVVNDDEEVESEDEESEDESDDEEEVEEAEKS